jgi:hypothetical protein
MNIFRPSLTIFIPLILGTSVCHGQAADTTTRKPGILKRLNQSIQQRQQQLEERMERQQEDQERLRNRPLTAADTADKWSLSFNAPGLLELQMAVGLGVGYQISRHWQVWIESSYLGQMYASPPETCIGGIREILAVKYYLGPRQSLFFAGEFRFKQVYYHDVQNFYNGGSNTTLTNYTYTLENVIFGGAAWFGGRIRLSADHRWRSNMYRQDTNTRRAVCSTTKFFLFPRAMRRDWCPICRRA